MIILSHTYFWRINMSKCPFQLLYALLFMLAILADMFLFMTYNTVSLVAHLIKFISFFPPQISSCVPTTHFLMGESQLPYIKYWQDKKCFLTLWFFVFSTDCGVQEHSVSFHVLRSSAEILTPLKSMANLSTTWNVARFHQYAVEVYALWNATALSFINVLSFTHGCMCSQTVLPSLKFYSQVGFLQ